MTDITLSIGFFISALMQGATGFGSAIGMNAFLTKIASIQIVSPTIAIMTLILNITMLSRQANFSHYPELRSLLGWSFAGIPFGLLLLKTLPTSQAVIIISILITLLGIFQIWSQYHKINLQGRILNLICFCAGLFGFAYNVSGLFIALFVLSINLEKQRSIRLTATYFLIMNAISCCIFRWKGFFNSSVISLALTGLPRIIFGGLIGSRLSKYIPQSLYIILVRGFLLGSLVLMLL